MCSYLYKVTGSIESLLPEVLGRKKTYDFGTNHTDIRAWLKLC